jgi:hypothetical protein
MGMESSQPGLMETLMDQGMERIQVTKRAVDGLTAILSEGGNSPHRCLLALSSSIAPRNILIVRDGKVVATAAYAVSSKSPCIGVC